MVITGAGSGVGRKLSHYFAERGYQLHVTDIDLRRAQETCDQLPPGSKAKPSALDVTDAQAIDTWVADHLRQGIDVLINNAGLQLVAPLEEFPVERWKYLLDVMLLGPALFTRAVLPLMRKAQYGRIINIGSIHSLVASPFKSAYVAAKHGLVGLTKTIALESADTDITVNTICPAYIRTPLVDQQIAAQALRHGLPESEVVSRIMLEPMPKKCFITAEEVAGTIEFLLSPAARNITGQTIVIDGGWTIR